MPLEMQAARRRAAVADSELDLRALGVAIWRKKWRIVIPTLFAAAIAAAMVQILIPTYRSESRVLYEGRENIFLRPEADRSNTASTLSDEQAVTSQVQLVMSRDLAREVIGKLNLGTLPEFDPLLRGVSPIRTALAAVGIGRDPTAMTPEERVLEAYYRRINVYSVDKSRVVAIEFQSEKPELAARVADVIAESYLTFQQRAKQEQARSAGEWLAGEIATLRDRVAEAAWTQNAQELS